MGSNGLGGWLVVLCDKEKEQMEEKYTLSEWILKND